MIKIEVTDPRLHTSEELIRVARYLMDCAGVPMIEVNPGEENKKLGEKESNHKNHFFLDDPIKSEENRFEPGMTSETVASIVNRETVAASDGYNSFPLLPSVQSLVPPPPPPVPEWNGETHWQPKPAHEPVVMQDRTPVPGFAIPPAPTFPTGLIDSHGVAWNPEIHSRTQSLNADGSFKLKRGSSSGRSHVAKPKSKFEVISQSGITTIEEDLLPPVASPLTPAEPIKSEPPPVVENEFDVLMDEMLDLFASKKLEAGDIISFANEHGVASIPLLSAHPHLYPLLRQKIKDTVKLRGHHS